MGNIHNFQRPFYSKSVQSYILTVHLDILHSRLGVSTRVPDGTSLDLYPESGSYPWRWPLGWLQVSRCISFPECRIWFLGGNSEHGQSSRRPAGSKNKLRVNWRTHWFKHCFKEVTSRWRTKYPSDLSWNAKGYFWPKRFLCTK